MRVRSLLRRWRSRRAASDNITHGGWIMSAVGVGALTVGLIAVPGSPAHQWLSCQVSSVATISANSSVSAGCVGGTALPKIVAGPGSQMAFDPLAPFAIRINLPDGMIISNPAVSGDTASVTQTASGTATVSGFGTPVTASTSTNYSGSVWVSGTDVALEGTVGKSLVMTGSGDSAWSAANTPWASPATDTGYGILMLGPSESFALHVNPTSGATSVPYLSLLLATGQRDSVLVPQGLGLGGPVVLAGSDERFVGVPDSSTNTSGSGSGPVIINGPLVVAGNGDTVGSPSDPISVNGPVVVVGSNDTVYADTGTSPVSGVPGGMAAGVVTGSNNVVSGGFGGTVYESVGALAPGSSLSAPTYPSGYPFKVVPIKLAPVHLGVSGGGVIISEGS